MAQKPHEDVPYVDVPYWWIGAREVPLHGIMEPEKWNRIKCRPGTRWWEHRGTMEDFRTWIVDVEEWFVGNTIPLQWVPSFVGVTRMAVRNRANAGKLTIVSFLPLEYERTLLGRVQYKEPRERFDYAMISECQAWRDLVLVRRHASRGSSCLRNLKDQLDSRTAEDIA